MDRSLLTTHPRVLAAGVAACLAVASTGCTGASGTLDLDDDASADDDAAPGDDFEIDVTLSEVVPTVATVTFSTEHAPVVAAWVEFGSTTEYGTRVPVDVAAGSPYRAVLVGMKPSAAYRFRVVVDDGAATHASEDHEVQTGGLPAGFPEAAVTVEDETGTHSGFLVTSILSSPSAAVIVDADGDYVWWHQSEDPEFHVSRAHLAHDGSSVLYWGANAHPGEDPTQELVRVSMDGTQVEAISIPDGHHDFLELADGTIAYLEYDPRSDGGQTLVADRLVERAPDGTTTEVFSLWDVADASWESILPPHEGWSHANSLRYHEEDGTYTITSLGFEAIFQVDRASGEAGWIMGGEHGDFVDQDGERAFLSRPHQQEPIDGGILVFNNGTPEVNSSKVLEFEVDEGEGRVDLVWTYEPSPPLYCFSLGDVHRLPNGNTLAVFSVQGQIDELSPERELIWRLNMELGGAFGYVTWMERLHGTE